MKNIAFHTHTIAISDTQLYRMYRPLPLEHQQKAKRVVRITVVALALDCRPIEIRSHNKSSFVMFGFPFPFLSRNDLSLFLETRTHKLSLSLSLLTGNTTIDSRGRTLSSSTPPQVQLPSLSQRKEDSFANRAKNSGVVRIVVEQFFSVSSINDGY